MVCGDGCPHGDPNCTCLDQQASGWQPALLISTATSAVNNTSTFPTYQITPGFSPMTGVDIEIATPDECAEGHIVQASSIRYIKGPTEEDDEIIGFCLFCECRVTIPEVVGGLSFEKAGSAVGRAMTLQDDDNEKIGELLADLAQLERDAKAEIARIKRALGMIDIARDLAEQRAIEGLAETVA